jgi:hypothetical protein
MKTKRTDVLWQIARGALFLLACSALLRADGSIRVNAGGGAYTDSKGNLWLADSSLIGFIGGGGTFSTSSPIAKTSDPALYRTEHFGNGTLEFTTTIPNGDYSVTLKFAEIYFTGAGQRVFKIIINGVLVENNFDPFAAAGGINIAVDKTYPVTVTAGTIDIRLLSVIQNPKVSAIEIDPVPAPPNPPVGPFFADQETPTGAIDGVNTAFLLAHTPNPANSLLLIRNGLVLNQGSDYSLSGSGVTFSSGALPQAGDTLLAFYRY